MDRQHSLYMPGFLALLFSGFLLVLALGLAGIASFFLLLLAAAFGFLGFSLFRGYELARKVGAALHYLLLLLLLRMFLLFSLGLDTLKILFLRMGSELSNNETITLSMINSSLTVSAVTLTLFLLLPILVFRRCCNPTLKQSLANEGKTAWKFEHLSDEAFALLCYIAGQILSFPALFFQPNQGQDRQFFWPLLVALSAISALYYLWKIRPLSLILQSFALLFSLILSWTAQQNLASQTLLEENQFQDIYRVFISYKIREDLILLFLFVCLAYFYFQRVGFANRYSLNSSKSEKESS